MIFPPQLDYDISLLPPPDPSSFESSNHSLNNTFFIILLVFRIFGNELNSQYQVTEIINTLSEMNLQILASLDIFHHTYEQC